MSFFLVIAFLFCMGSLYGWCSEVIFRRFFSKANPERKWINPGFLTGPYLPIYGFGLVTLFLLASIEESIPIASPQLRKLLMFVIMSVCMTAIEYIAGTLMIHHAHIRLWDYSMCRGNIQGIICPQFSLYWALLGAAYYFLIHPRILDSLSWLSQNLAFSFFIGLFYGVFIIDFAQRTQMLVTLRRFAKEHEIVIKYEELRHDVRRHNIEAMQKARFWFDMHSDVDMKELLLEYEKHQKERREKIKEKVEKIISHGDR